MKPTQVVSAQVVLASASGTQPGPKAIVTSENIDEWRPSPVSVANVSAKFHDDGFEVGNCVGNSFSITGEAKLFEASFDTSLKEVNGCLQFADDGLQLAIEKIPDAVRSAVVAILFSEPPDFGPSVDSEFM